MSQLRQYSRARIAITTAFIINGGTIGATYARIPDIKEQLGISNSALGIALLCLPLGLLIGLGKRFNLDVQVTQIEFLAQGDACDVFSITW